MTELYLFNKEEVLINIIPEDDFNNDSHVRELNSKWSFEFTTTFQYLNDLSKSNKVGFYDRYREFRLFKIIKEPEVDYLSDEVVVNCLNDCYEMSDQIIEDKRLRDGTARQALDKVLEGSSYEVGEVAELGNRTINFYDISRMEGLNNIIESYGGELDYRIEFDADFKRISHKYVDIKSRLGQDTGLRFTYDLNLESVVRKDVSESHCTVLYGRGGAIESGDGYSRKIKFTDVEWKKPTNPIDKPIGQTYIEDLDAIAKYGRIEGIYENSDIEEPGELLQATYEALQECKNPKLSYEVNAKDLASQNSDYDHLTVVLGDSVILLDEDYDLNLESRIVGFEESIKEESAEMKWIIGNVQSSFSSDNASSGQIIKPSTGDVDIEIDDDKFPDALPDVPIIEAEGLFGSVIISWTYESKSYYEYELYASKLESFNPDASNLIFRGKASSYHHQVKPSETWYYRARAINTHGRTTDFSSQVKASTLKIEDGTEYFEKAAIADALIGELRLDRGWVGQLRGNWIDAKQLSVTDGNGKRTLDIDSFGNVNLDVTSLKIKNNSVATESFVSNEKNDAINSANNNTTIALENHYTKSETDSKISVAKDEINLGVSNTYETKTNVETKVASTLNSAKSYSDTKKTEAINAAATDATNKVNSAKTELNAAIGKKANSADVYTKTQVYTKDETNSQINIAKEAINLGVSNTYETKANVTTKVSNAVVEARRITDSRNTNQNPQWYMTNYPKQTISEFKSANVIGIPNASTNYGTLTTNTPWKDASGSYPVQTFKSSDYKTYERRGTSLTNLGGWVQIENAIDSQTKANTAKQEAITSANNTLTTTIANYYTKAQTDSQINVAKNAITQSVSSTYATKTDVTSSINGVNSSISSLTTRISNAESKITDTAITNTVKKNFYTKEETNNQITSKGYQTSSQVQQTVNNLQIKFTESGGYNLIRNSSGLNGTNLWTGTATLGTATNTTIGSACDKYMYLDNGTTTSERFAYSSRFKLKPSTTYTLTGWFHNYTKCPSFDVHVLSSTSVDSSDTGLSHTHGHYLIKAQNTNGTWKKYTVSFTTPSGCRSGVVRIDNNGYNSKGSDSNRVQWSALVLSEGSLEVPWTPHPNEVYDGITTIDKNGVTVKGSNNAYTNFNSLGMNSFNNSGQQTMGIRNGGITFNPYSSNQLGAYITQSALWGGSAAANGLAISTANNGSYIALGTSSLNDANATLNMDQALTISAIDSFQPIGINFWKDVHAHGYGIRQLSHLQLAGSGAIQFDYLNNSPSTIYEAVDSGHSLYVMGGYQMHLGCMDGKGVPKGVIWMQNSTNTHSYTHWDFHNYTMYNMKTASTYANYDTRRISESYGVTSNVDGVRYLYKNVELVNGKAIRSIPLEYKGCEYDIVSIVCKGRGSAWVETEDENRFEINGECKSVNIEIIIYPSEAVMTASTQQLEEAPTLELPKKTEPEEALLITNEVV